MNWREDRLSRRPFFSKRNILDANNARWCVDKNSPRTLHPTKGWRRVNPKLTLASTIVGMVKQGRMCFELSQNKSALKIAGGSNANATG